MIRGLAQIQILRTPRPYSSNRREGSEDPDEEEGNKDHDNDEDDPHDVPVPAEEDYLYYGASIPTQDTTL
eukprot:7304328-Prorocentrum_lima.AAC.1